MNKIFSSEEKAQIMRDYKASRLNVPAYSRQSGVSETTLYKWRKNLIEDKREKKELQEFVEIGRSEKDYYEIRWQDVVLKIPASEQTSRIAEIFKKLTEC